MSALIQSIEHGLAIAASDAVKVARFIQSKVLPELKAVQASEAAIERVTGLISPQAVNIERIGFALVGLAIRAIEDAGGIAVTTTGQGITGQGIPLVLDAALVADLKAIAATVKAAAVK